MTGKVSRNKGQRGERKVRDKLRKLFPDCERELNDFQGDLGIDLRNTGKLSVQVKHFKTHASFSKIQEIKNPRGSYPLLVSWPTNPGTGKPMVAMYLDDFLEVVDPNKVGSNV